jgi:hypothetical protein
MLRWLAAGSVAVALFAGCREDERAAQTAPTTTAAPPATTAGAAPDPSPPATSSEIAPPDEPTTDRATMERAVRAWSEHLNTGDNDAVAQLFSLPALIAQGNQVGEFRTHEELAGFFAGLPCSGTVVSISYDEPNVALAVFELFDRPTSPCDAPPGTLAAARFVFRDGRLVAWQQVPVPAEEPGGATEPGAATEPQA